MVARARTILLMHDLREKEGNEELVIFSCIGILTPCAPGRRLYRHIRYLYIGIRIRNLLIYEALL